MCGRQHGKRLRPDRLLGLQQRIAIKRLNADDGRGHLLFRQQQCQRDWSVFPFELAYGGNLWYWKHARVGRELGFGLLPISIPKTALRWQQLTSRLILLTRVALLCQPHLTGGFNRYGEPTISTSASITNNQYAGTVTGKQTLDVMLYTVRLGPTMYWDLTEHVSLSLGAGPAVGVVSGDYKYDEMITASGVNAHNSGQIGGTDFVYGGYVNATVLCHVTDNGDIFAGAQFMPMSDATISGGGRMGRLNLGGQVYFTVGINWPF